MIVAKHEVFSKEMLFYIRNLIIRRIMTLSRCVVLGKSFYLNEPPFHYYSFIVRMDLKYNNLLGYRSASLCLMMVTKCPLCSPGFNCVLSAGVGLLGKEDL